MKHTTIWRFIKAHDDILGGKLLELHALVTEWLSYIPATFPHYTRHTVAHSEQIIEQVSRLLFFEGNPEAPVVDKFSAMEAYIICVSALLHDSGMVVSDDEKRRILQSDEWTGWLASDGPARHWSSVVTMRHEAEGTKDPYLHFNADILTRHLIAEFVRREHHTRAAKLAFSSQTELARFAFDDPILLRTVADVCEAHGLPLAQLEDHSRFPDRRTIGSYEVNVRFVAAALRLGDLLDMSSDRACPLIMSAACPLPLESIAHWSQYQKIKHRLVAPDVIELNAECDSQDEHRYLYDWCSWLVDELKATSSIASKWKRHSAWKPPSATIDGANPTINVRPSATATYIPSDWSIQLDKSAVLSLLTGQLYESDLAFLRELVQNAVDAARCRLSEEVTSRGEELPEYLTDVDSRLREMMPITVSLDKVKVKGELFAENAEEQLVAVTDAGLGMTRSVIERFFLQVGRSYYKTEEFRRAFKFTPSSRFGIGFLSCFGVSDHVTVDTKPYNSTEGALRLVLTGPASYVLTEKSRRAEVGTTVSVRLRKPISAEVVEQQLSAWFPALEFPLRINSESRLRVVRPIEVTEQDKVPVTGEEDAYFFIKVVPFRREGLIGRLYIFVKQEADVERWDRHSWAHQAYREKYPSENPPLLPESIVSFHGAAVSDHRYRANSSFSEHVDIRGAQFEIAASRSHFYGRGRVPGYHKVMDSLWDEVLGIHLVSPESGDLGADWKYLNRLFMKRGSLDFWSLRKCVPMVVGGICAAESLKSVERRDEIAVIGMPRTFSTRKSTTRTAPVNLTIPYIEPDQESALARELKKALLEGRNLLRVEFLEDGDLVSIWSRSVGDHSVYGDSSDRLVYCEFSNCDVAGAAVLSSIEWERSVGALNTRHGLSRFIQQVIGNVESGNASFSTWHVTHLLELVKHCVEYSNKVDALKEFGGQLINMDPSLNSSISMLHELTDQSFTNSFSWRRGLRFI